MTVHLVGAGPGDPELVTVRGAALLARADVIIYDRLIAHALLDLAPPGAERIDVGKKPGRPTRQSDINALLIEHGGKGREVVRLKGGDPFLFGRGGEEAEALQAAGIPYDVVPGVTSAFAAPAAAGIPVTHRGLSTSVTVVTGHVGDPSAPGGVDWRALAQAGGTLVVMMGMADRARIAEALIDGGRPPDTPVTVVHWGTTDEQRTERTTLDGLAEVDLPAPCTIVIGPVAGLDLRSTAATPGGGSTAATPGGGEPT
ncbi:MAG TPA: uroporphyrinogen-III C-methyltransferase [Acidimicrobiales bacterium]